MGRFCQAHLILIGACEGPSHMPKKFRLKKILWQSSHVDTNQGITVFLSVNQMNCDFFTCTRLTFYKNGAGFPFQTGNGTLNLLRRC